MLKENGSLDDGATYLQYVVEVLRTITFAAKPSCQRLIHSGEAIDDDHQGNDTPVDAHDHHVDQVSVQREWGQAEICDEENEKRVDQAQNDVQVQRSQNDCFALIADFDSARLSAVFNVNVICLHI